VMVVTYRAHAPDPENSRTAKKFGDLGTSQDARPARAAAQDSFSGLEASRSSISSTTRSWGSSAALMRYLRLPPSAGTTCTTV
jgi:hypothetical protein